MHAMEGYGKGCGLPAAVPRHTSPFPFPQSKKLWGPLQHMCWLIQNNVLMWNIKQWNPYHQNRQLNFHSYVSLFCDDGCCVSVLLQLCWTCISAVTMFVLMSLCAATKLGFVSVLRQCLCLSVRAVTVCICLCTATKFVFSSHFSVLRQSLCWNITASYCRGPRLWSECWGHTPGGEGGRLACQGSPARPQVLVILYKAETHAKPYLRHNEAFFTHNWKFIPRICHPSVSSKAKVEAANTWFRRRQPSVWVKNYSVVVGMF